jgi:hypothetical protein
MAGHCRARVGLLVVGADGGEDQSGRLTARTNPLVGANSQTGRLGVGPLLDEPMVCREQAGSDLPRSSVAAARIAGRFGYAGALNARISRTT